MYKMKTDMNYPCLVQNKRKLFKKKKNSYHARFFPLLMHLQNRNKYELSMLMAGILPMLCKTQDN